MTPCRNCGSVERSASGHCRACHRAAQRAWVARNPNKAKTVAKSFRDANKKKIVARVKVWQVANPTIVREYKRAWNLANPESRRLFQLRRRARLAGAAGRGVTAAQWRERLEQFNYACGYCLTRDESLAMDHMNPISRNGIHDVDNVIPACRSCNSTKGNRSILLMAAVSIRKSAA